MQIHELNNFTGNLDGSAYMAVDNGTDTGKVSVAGLLLDVNQSIDEAEESLNARIDNIIAGGTAPSAAEVTDARLGASVLGGITYPSLGDAIRAQISQVKNNIDGLDGIVFDVDNYFINSIGNPSPNNDYHITDFILLSPGSSVGIIDCFAGSSSCGIAFYTESKEFISGINSIDGNYTVAGSSVPSNAKYVRFGSAKTYNSKKYVSSAFIINSVEISILLNQLSNRFNSLIIDPEETSFFEGLNYFDPNFATLYTDRYIDAAGNIVSTSGDLNTLVFPCEPSTTYYLQIPGANRSMLVESADNNFTPGQTKTSLISDNRVYPVMFTTSASAHYIGVYFYSGVYDYNSNKDNIVLNKNNYYGIITPFIMRQYLPADIGNPLLNQQIMIFGDSITDCCNLTINASKETTSYVWKNPSNSYVDGGGQTINFSMWPKILKEHQPCGEIRNYAYTGASYKTAARSPGDERQNLHYQIDVALNDLDNPNNVFSIANYVPDIVIFALGTNDGAPNDTYDSAMAKTVYQGDGVSIDTVATMAGLDTSQFCESARCAFMRIKNAFPMAQIFVVLPIQRANNDTNLGTLHEYLKQMAQRYGCIIVDGAFETGITRDFNKWNALGNYLKDGLHPNEKGQNLLARAIIASLTSHYMPFGNGFNS